MAAKNRRAELADRPAGNAYDEGAGVRLLLIMALMVLGGVQRQWQNLPMSWALAALLGRLALTPALVRYLARIEWSGIGLRPFARWERGRAILPRLPLQDMRCMQIPAHHHRLGAVSTTPVTVLPSLLRLLAHTNVAARSFRRADQSGSHERSPPHA